MCCFKWLNYSFLVQQLADLYSEDIITFKKRVMHFAFM